MSVNFTEDPSQYFFKHSIFKLNVPSVSDFSRVFNGVKYIFEWLKHAPLPSAWGVKITHSLSAVKAGASTLIIPKWVQSALKLGEAIQSAKRCFQKEEEQGVDIKQRVTRAAGKVWSKARPFCGKSIKLVLCLDKMHVIHLDHILEGLSKSLAKVKQVFSFMGTCQGLYESGRECCQLSMDKSNIDEFDKQKKKNEALKDLAYYSFQFLLCIFEVICVIFAIEILALLLLAGSSLMFAGRLAILFKNNIYPLTGENLAIHACDAVIPNLLGKRLKILADIYHKTFFVL